MSELNMFGSFLNSDTDLVKYFKDVIFLWERLNGGTVPPDKTHPGGTVPPDKTHPGGTVPPDKTHHGGTIPPSKWQSVGTVI